jgi:hypothetical protein
MRSISSGAIVSLALTTLSFSQDSFLLSEEESKEVQEILSAAKQRANGDKEDMELNNLKVSGILYVDSDNWIIWINGKSYSSIGEHSNFSIDSVSEDTVTLSLKDGSTRPLTVDNRDSGDDGTDVPQTEHSSVQQHAKKSAMHKSDDEDVN